MGLIYKIANDVNDKVYVGQTTKTLKLRIRQHLCESRRGSNCIIHKAIRKYKWKHFKVEILEDNIPLENLNKRELYYTEKYNALAPNGYVLIAGGEPRIISKETRIKMSKAKQGKNNPLYGKHHSKETLKRMSKKRKYKNMGKNNPNSKSILCYDLEDNFIKEYDSIADASRKLNLNCSHVSEVCQGKFRRAGNYKFKYKIDE